MDSTRHDWRIIDTVISRTAECSGVDPLEMEPLGAAIDPRLVSAFAASEAVEAGSELRFSYGGCEVRIDAEGEVTVRDED